MKNFFNSLLGDDTNQEQEKTLSDAEIIQQIHDHAHQAQAALMQEAEAILSQAQNFTPEEIQSVDSLASMGFKNEKNVVEITAKLEEQRRIQTKYDVIKYYAEKYPFNKFIPVSVVYEICEKYGLLIARADRFIDVIPEFNKNEILNFRVDQIDLLDKAEFVVANAWSRNRYPYWVNREFRITSGMKQRWGIDKKNIPTGQRPRSVDNRLGSVDMPLDDGAAVTSSNFTQGTDLYVIATKDQFNTSNMEQVGYTLSEIKDDPIVLQPVACGLLIVTAWGPEAKDSQIVNENKN